MLQALIGSIFGVGLFLILVDCFRVPFFKTSKAINNLAKRQEKKTSTLDIWLGDLAMWISKRLRINEFKRMQLEIDLRSAGVNMSPEMHIANSIVKSMLIGILAVPANQAQDAADTMAASGLKAIWNFTPYRIKVAEGIVMSNTSIYAHLALIYNRLRATT